MLIFKNLTVTGRNGRFVYTHIHDMVVFAQQAVQAIASATAERADRTIAAGTDSFLATGFHADRAIATSIERDRTTA